MSSTLTKGEICASYRQAKKPEKQIPILAQLCGYPVEEIENILRSCGFAVKSSGCVKRAEIHWTTYKYRELERCLALGMTERDIAANLHCTVYAARAAKYRLKKQKASESEKSEKSEKENEPAAAGADTSSQRKDSLYNNNIIIQQNGGFVKRDFYV